MSGQNNTQYATPFAIGQPGTNWGGGAQALAFRDPLDAVRAQQGNRTPNAEYPDGYLGTIQSRREDRLLNSIKNTQNQRGYQRGVHKGERIDPSDYFWPSELQDTAGIMRMAATPMDPVDRLFHVPRAAPLGTLFEQLQADGDTLPTTPRGKMRPLIPEGAPESMRNAALRALLPNWRTA
jgi:hypothetical protein